MRRTNSGPSFENQSATTYQVDMLMPQNVPAIPYGSHHTSMNTVKIISDDSSSQHHVSGQFVEDDIDLPATPVHHNRANSLPKMVQTTSNNSSINGVNGSEHVFDISRASFGALFDDTPDIMDNTPTSTMKPNSKMPSTETNLTNQSSLSPHSNHIEKATEIKGDIDANIDGNIDGDGDRDKGDDEKNVNLENNLMIKLENDTIINSNDADGKERENDDSDHQNKKDDVPPTNISPKQNKKSSPVLSGIKTNLNTMAGFNTINKKPHSKIPSISNLQIHAKDPDAVPASPPIESVYKPVPQDGMMSRLSQISESNGLSSAGSSPMGYTRNDKNTIPETDVVNKSSNESFPDDNYQQDHSKDHIHDEHDEHINIPPQIDTVTPLPDPKHLLPQKMSLLSEALSSPSDVCFYTTTKCTVTVQCLFTKYVCFL